MDILENVRSENCFYCVDGSVLRNILELEQKLRAISSRAFYHHVNKSRNDFGNWVKGVFHEHNLANELLKAKTPAEAAGAVRMHIRKTFLAEEEIESAIRKVVEERKPAKSKAVVMAAKKLPKQKTQAKRAAKIHEKTAKTAAATKTKHRQQKNKNRKLNKKQNKEVSSRSSYGKRGKRVRRSNGGNMLRKAVKNQARQWLKWLSINPKL